MATLGVNDLISQIRTGASSMADSLVKRHEFDMAMTMGVSAMQFRQLEERKKTSDQVNNNRTMTALVDNQLTFYRREYNDLPGKMTY